VLAPAIARSRRARNWLASAGIGDLGHVELEPRVAAVYLEDAPPGQKALLARLLRGESLRALLDTPEAADGAQIAATLLELVRRGGLSKLVDRDNEDVLLPDAARSSVAARGPRSPSEAPAVVMPAAMTLAEAVLQAVSGGPDAHERPSARRTHPGLAPPTSLVESSLQRTAPSKPPLPGTGATESRSAGARPLRGAPLPSGPREVTEAWSSEPDDADDLDAASAPGAELDDEPALPATLPRRIRAVVSPLLVTLGAAALAFAGMRVIMGGTLERWGVAPATEVLGDMPDPVDAGRASEPLPPPSPAASPPAPAEPADAATPSAEAPAAAPPPGVPSSATEEARAIPLDVDVSTEILDAPREPALRAGQGLLEVRTWEPQRIYVDGVFMGNYAARLIPLSPGDYRIRLFDGARDIEQTAHVEPGRRTRLWARTKSSP
jgi:hypothetical protein